MRSKWNDLSDVVLSLEALPELSHDDPGTRVGVLRRRQDQWGYKPIYAHSCETQERDGTRAVQISGLVDPAALILLDKRVPRPSQAK